MTSGVEDGLSARRRRGGGFPWEGRKGELREGNYRGILMWIFSKATPSDLGEQISPKKTFGQQPRFFAPMLKDSITLREAQTK